MRRYHLLCNLLQVYQLTRGACILLQRSVACATIAPYAISCMWLQHVFYPHAMSQKDTPCAALELHAMSTCAPVRDSGYTGCKRMSAVQVHASLHGHRLVDSNTCPSIINYKV